MPSESWVRFDPDMQVYPARRTTTGGSPCFLAEMYAATSATISAPQPHPYTATCVVASDSTTSRNKENIIDQIQRSSLYPNMKAAAIRGVNREFDNYPRSHATEVGSLMPWMNTVEGHHFWEKVSEACHEVRRSDGY